jgi:hypothetical protein
MTTQTYTTDDVSFNAQEIATEWEEFGDGIPAVAAAALLNEFTEYDVDAEDGIEADRDVIFTDVDVMVEEKAMGVCPRKTAEQFAPAYIELEREDRRVLALNGAAIYENHVVPGLEVV